MNALLRIGARLLPLATALTLSSCMSMSGLGGDSKYACKAPDGVTCDSVSGTYANAVANNLPSQRKRQAVTGASQAERQALRPAAVPRAGLPAAGGSSPQEAGAALRAQARYLRLWVKPWEDIDGDLYDQAHVYVQIDQGRWLIDHVQQRIRDAYTPLRPPPAASSTAPVTKSAARAEAAPAIARPSPLLPGLGAGNAAEVPR
ncbi:TraV family lipoprotein [Dechloromonas agitata]|uniref:TraV family lipoprotein n=1 Tax=Dechloromonas agitata TaxID=73030 RepID=UPI00237E171C|nr:TraV family lipoprotein [Dechloromonas agitata]MDE1543959.1 TraV family lipoprotein [Dechloromonas agitata]